MRGFRCPEWVSDLALAEASAHMLAEYPKEGVGFMTAQGFVPVVNVAADPLSEFEVMTEEWFEHGPVLAVVHSHPKHTPPVGTGQGLSFPSRLDMHHQATSAVPWAIMVCDGEHVAAPIWFGDQLPMAPLYGRPFMHGVADCYSLVRDLYRTGREGLAALPEVGERIYHWPHEPILLPDMARENEWWTAPDGGENFYTQHFASVGFEKLDTDPHRPAGLQVGDGFIMCLNSKVPNHAGIYVGNGLLLHHVTGYTSHRSPLHLWALKVSTWLRYTGPGSAHTATE